jgi:hypothetical protein
LLKVRDEFLKGEHYSSVAIIGLFEEIDYVRGYGVS